MSKKVAESIFQRFKTPEYKEYFMSTHFWAPASSFFIPIAAIADINRDPKLISGRMTVALCMYSAAFIRFSWKVKPRNLLLLSCHVLNETVQIIELIRHIRFHAAHGHD